MFYLSSLTISSLFFFSNCNFNYERERESVRNTCPTISYRQIVFRLPSHTHTPSTRRTAGSSLQRHLHLHLHLIALSWMHLHLRLHLIHPHLIQMHLIGIKCETNENQMRLYYCSIMFIFLVGFAWNMSQEDQYKNI